MVYKIVSSFNTVSMFDMLDYGRVRHVRSDNMLVVQALHSLHTYDEYFRICIQNLLVGAVKCNIHIQTSQVGGFKNKVADVLSQLRENEDRFWWVRELL